MMVRTGLALALLGSATLVAQIRGGFINPTPTVTGSFGNVVFPGGTGNMPGITRTFGNATFPGGGGPHFNVPLAPHDPSRFAGTFNNFNRGERGARRSSVYAFPYVVPVYYGGYGFSGYPDNSYGYGYPDQGVVPPQQQAPNVVVIYANGPQQPAGNAALYQPSSPQASAPEAAPEDSNAQVSNAPAMNYLIAFKDHTIYSAVAYWVEGDTLHYFTSGSTHNQVSLSLVDKDLTERLNREAGVAMQLP